MNLIWNHLFLSSNTVLARKEMYKADTLTAEHQTNQHTELDTLCSAKMNFFCHPEDSFMCAILVKFVVL